METLIRAFAKVLKFAVAVVCCYALAVTFTNMSLYADDGNVSSAPSDASKAQEVKPAAATPSAEATPALATQPTLGLLMSALDKVGVASPLTKAGINIYGYAEGGWFYDATSPQKADQRLSDIIILKAKLLLTRLI